VLILPGTGRGAMRSMVERVRPARNQRALRVPPTPSTAYDGPPPRAGKDLV